MKFLLDHDVPAEIAHLLRYWEHNVTVLRTVLPVTASDEEVFDHACSQGLILISCNRDHFPPFAPSLASGERRVGSKRKPRPKLGDGLLLPRNTLGFEKERMEIGLLGTADSPQLASQDYSK